MPSGTNYPDLHARFRRDDVAILHHGIHPGRRPGQRVEIGNGPFPELQVNILNPPPFPPACVNGAARELLDSGCAADVVRVGVCQENPLDLLRFPPDCLHVGKNGLFAPAHAGINQVAGGSLHQINIREPPDLRRHLEINPELVQPFTQFHHHPSLSR